MGAFTTGLRLGGANRNQASAGGTFPASNPPPASEICDTSTWTDNSTTYYCYGEFERLVSTQGDDENEPVYNVHDGLDRRDYKIIGSDQNAKIRELSYVGTSELLSREKTQGGEKQETYDYDSRGVRTGQLRRTSTTPSEFSSYATDSQGSVIALEGENGEIVNPKLLAGAGLITRRSRVQIPPPLFEKAAAKQAAFFASASVQGT